MTRWLRYRALTATVFLLLGGNGSRKVHAFTRIPSRIPQQHSMSLRRHRQPHSLMLKLQATATTADEDSVHPASYQWTRPTLDIAVPALIGMMAGKLSFTSDGILDESSKKISCSSHFLRLFYAIDPLLSLMDTAFVGHLGAIELASLGACTSIFHLAFNAFRATTTATTSLVSSALQRSPEEAKEVTQLSLSLGIIMGLTVLIGLRSSGTWCLKTMGIPRNSPLFPPAHAYLNTRLWAAPTVLGIVVAEGAFRGYANTKIPLIASLVAAMINLVLDPVMIFPMGLGVMGAAAATALSQVGAATIYAYFLKKKQMLPTRNSHVSLNRIKVIQTILGANMAMFAKQGSLLLAWAYATSKATRLGAAHVAAHQVALSFWLVFALLLDGAAVSAQVLMSKAHGAKDVKQIRSLSSYMTKFAIGQGLISTLLITCLGTFIPELFTTDKTIQYYLHQLMPHLAAQQVLISLTFVLESMSAGASQFNLLAVGTTLSTIVAVLRLKDATDVMSIWSRGIVTLFVGRFFTAMIGTARINGLFAWRQRRKQKTDGHGTAIK